MKKIFLFSILLLNFFTSSFAQKDPKAKQVLDAVKQKYKALTAFKANFSVNASSPTAGTNENFNGEITVKSTKFYLKLPDQQIITDGTTQWTYVKDANEVNITDYEPEPDDITPNKIYEIYETDYDYSYVEEKVESGKKYHIIDLKPKKLNTQYFKLRLKITSDANSIKSWEIFEKNSNRYLYTITRFATVSVGDGYFKYNKNSFPNNHKVNDLR
jgi:outer membrane lipoprotein-sorting protein